MFRDTTATKLNSTVAASVPIWSPKLFKFSSLVTRQRAVLRSAIQHVYEEAKLNLKFHFYAVIYEVEITFIGRVNEKPQIDFLYIILL